VEHSDVAFGVAGDVRGDVSDRPVGQQRGPADLRIVERLHRCDDLFVGSGRTSHVAVEIVHGFSPYPARERGNLAGMQLAMVGLGRMGANMVRRLQRAGHDCVAYDLNPAAVQASEAGRSHAARELRNRLSTR
jgi:hypothetical protein